MSLGGFKTIDLNAAGWLALLGPGIAVGAVVGVARDEVPVAAAIAVGAIAAFGVGRLADEISDRRRWQWIAVVPEPDARSQLQALGIAILGETSTAVGGRAVRFVAVRQRDASRAEAAVGLPTTSRRGGRRSRDARMAALLLDPPRRRR